MPTNEKRIRQLEIDYAAHHTILSSLEKQIDLRFQSAKDLVTAAFAASDKAITKAEEAQREYNVRSNEFRGQLDDQAKLLMPRNEVMGIIKSIEEKIDASRTHNENSLLSIKEDIKSLRESRSEGSGRQSGISAAWAIGVTVLNLIIALASKFLGG